MGIKRPFYEHAWNLNEDEAARLQKELADKVIKNDDTGTITYVAGVDVAYDVQNCQQFAAAVVLHFDSWSMIETSTVQEALRFSYVSGYFSFRELPTIIKALKKLRTVPDLIVLDGHGVAHPRRCGLASHLGILYNLPTIGCSKTRLIGEADEPGPMRGDGAPLMDRGETIGCVLRTQNHVKPVYVSIGHRISLQTACDWILKLASKYRLPETTRYADQMVRRMRKAYSEHKAD